MENDAHILIVEDSHTQAVELQYCLENNGYKVSMAEDGEQAFAMLKDITPTIIITDIVMPRMNGYEFCNKIKENDKLKDIPVILLTSLSEPEDVINGLMCGANNFILKPFDEEFLLSRISYTLINQEIRKSASTEMGIAIIFREKKYFLTSERIQMIDLLLTTYEVAFQRNLDFEKSNEELQQAREGLEKRVQERTAELSKSNIQLKKEIEERKHVEESLRRSENELAIRNQMSQLFITAPDNELFENILKVVLEAIKSKYGVFGYVDEDGALICHSLTGDVWEECKMPDKDIIFPPESWVGIWGRAFTEGKTLYSNEPLQVLEDHIQITRALDVPIIHRRNIIGNLLIGNKEMNYEEDDIKLMEAIAVHLAPLLNARLQRDRQIKEHKKLEEQLHQTQKMEAIGTLAGGVAHDFNNLLTAIIGHSEIMLRKVDKESSLRGSIEEIKKASDRAASLTNQLLAFSRKQMIQPVVLNINRSLAEMDKMLRRLIGEDIDLATILEPKNWKVKFDPGQMDQVIMNLAVNAKDAMPKGGKLTIETANVDLDEAYAHQHGVKLKPGPFVVLAVSDTGMGIDEETQSHIFEPFFTTKEQGKGTGLGLSTVYGIVKQSGGFIWVYSELGQGTSFKIYLPKSEEKETFLAEAQIQPQNFEGSETILLAEDEDSARKLIRSALQEYGYWILEAQDGKEALQLSEHHQGPIHLLLTDVVMPGMSGRELAEHLQPLQPKMKVLYMSGYTDNAIIHHGVLDSGTPFIQKPFTPKVLASKVRKVLDA